MNQPKGFAPQLFLRSVLAGMDFYKKAFDAMELRRWSNSDESVHVAELSIDGAMFHLHEEVTSKSQMSPETAQGITVLLGLFVDDPHAVVKRAVAAGARELSAVTDYEYGYRQGTIIDPFGHQWLIEKKFG
jgi:PhnB protein